MRHLTYLMLCAVAANLSCKSSNALHSHVLESPARADKMIEFSPEASAAIVEVLVEARRLDNPRTAESFPIRVINNSKERLECHRDQNIAVCSAKFETSLVRGNIAKILVAGQMVLDPSPVTSPVVLPSANHDTNQVWLPVITDDNGRLVVGNVATNLGEADFDLKIYQGKDLEIRCSAKGLNQEACLFLRSEKQENSSLSKYICRCPNSGPNRCQKPESLRLTDFQILVAGGTTPSIKLESVISESQDIARSVECSSIEGPTLLKRPVCFRGKAGDYFLAPQINKGATGRYHVGIRDHSTGPKGQIYLCEWSTNLN